MQPSAIHQFSPSSAHDDRVTSGLLFTRKILRSLGFVSEIYCVHVARELENQILPYQQYHSAPDQVLLVHHRMGHDREDWLRQLQDCKVMVYHNPPARFFSADSVPDRSSLLGRQQLKAWAREFRGAIGDSGYDTAELRDAGYRPVATIPLLLDVEKIMRETWDSSIPARYRNTFNILFVGRIAENKCQHDLIKVLIEFRHLTDLPARLILVGDTTSPDYLERLRRHIAFYGLQGHVELPGKVDNATLHGYYRAADVFVCLSEHEGFGMPLIEAMLRDVPVIAYNSSNVGNTLGTAGILFQKKRHREIAVCIKLLSENPGLWRRVIKSQRRDSERFAFAVLRRQLHGFLSGLGLTMPALAELSKVTQPSLRYRIEGPFDSSYSLAAVNREMALALAAAGEAVGLFSTEGNGDFPPDQAFLRANPEVAELWKRARSAPRAEIVLRNLYPPRVDGMRGLVNGMNAYGWEESGFPPAYVEGFNRRLDLLTVMSRYVEKVMRDNGVKVPTAVVGVGADHILSVRSRPVGVALGRSYRFLHVSSGFPRKGIDVLLAAYGKAFSRGDEVSLVIKTIPSPLNTVEQQIRAARADNPDYPDIVLINEDLDDGCMVELYRNCHALVAPSRGEGFGLPMAEAMLFGLPVITTGYGGQVDFCTPETAWLIDYRFARARTHMALYDSVWAEPDVDHLAKLMREVCGAAPEVIRTRTARAKAEILARHKWADVVARLQQAVRTVDSAAMLYPPQPRIGWISTWHTRCGIAGYSCDLLSEFPRWQYTVFANRVAAPDLTEPDDDRVVRCWEARDDDTLEDLYRAVIERGCQAVVLQFNFGFFGLPHLADWIQRIKDRGIALYVFPHSTADVARPARSKSLTQIRYALALADRLLVHSVADLNRLKEFGLVENVALFPHGVTCDAGGVSASRNASRQARKRLVASTGFLLPPEGIPQMIQAFTQLAAEQPDLNLLLLNALYPISESSDERAACLALIEASGFAERITMINDFLEPVEIRRRLADADLIVYPYQHTHESSGAAVRLGLAARRPVAVTPLAIFEDVADVVLTLPGTSVDAMAQGIRGFLARPDLLAQCLQRQNAWLEAHSWPILAERLGNMLAATATATTARRPESAQPSAAGGRLQ